MAPAVLVAPMPSGGSTTRGRHHRDERIGSASERAVAGGLGGTAADHGVGSVAGRILGPGRLGRGISGTGPKGYARSDERIREDVCDRLTDDPELDASSIDVRVEKGEVTLDGTVGHRQDKRHAEDLIDDVSGVKHVQNNLRVEPDSERGPGGRATNIDLGPTSWLPALPAQLPCCTPPRRRCGDRWLGLWPGHGQAPPHASPRGCSSYPGCGPSVGRERRLFCPARYRIIA
jgi:hypothetical protein